MVHSAKMRILNAPSAWVERGFHYAQHCVEKARGKAQNCDFFILSLLAIAGSKISSGELSKPE
jgi:hypothetical protein